ncbi:N-acetylneuraminate synthase family protein [Halalkaliarchaeum desulfuricum]|uniref:N-acetylneuraminate synthase family protein n=1 Tax=Halalkaliarchaeum desulfuricum TaxID=2055893 RepID=UPI001FECC32D|nr:N-acetylneuraminate synthase family protein [Halalkaliarchaeum desulfuricum]
MIAEAGINHNGSIQIAKELVDVAVEAGADAVKFQKRKLTETYVEDIVEDPAIAEMGVEYTVSNLKDVLLTDNQYRELAEYCEEQGIQFLCSPWDEDSVDFLEDIGIPAYKVGSPDMTNFVLLERLLETGKPLLLSTGMSEEREIDRTVEFLQERDAEFGLLHCRSTYPSPFHNLNLDFMNELKRRYQVPVGYSGHERGIAVSSSAVAMGACVIERHFTLSRDMDGPDHSASLEPQGLEKLIRDIRNIEESRGTPRRYITRGEYNNRVSLAKSLATTRNIQKGEEITREDLTSKSPAKGISPQELYNVVGKRAQRDIGSDELLQWEAIEDIDGEKFDIDLENWGIVVRFSDISEHDWGNPDVFEFRINGADLEQKFEIESYDKQLGIHAPEQKGHDVVDLSARDETRRQEAVDIMQRVIDKVREDVKPHFETEEPPIVIHPGGITEHDMNLEAVPEMNDALERSMNELDDDGVQLLLENMPPLPWIYGGQQYHNNFMDADEIAEYCERTGQKICYDTSHAKLWCNYAGEDLYEHAKTLRPYTEYLHVADGIGVDGEGIQIGEGEIDFARLMELYQDFDGPIVTEIWRGHERKGRGFKKAAETLSQYI